MSRKALFQATPQKLELSGGHVYARSMTVGEMLRVEQMEREKKDVDALAYILKRCVTNDAGEPLLSADESIDDLPLETVRIAVEAVRNLSLGKPLKTLEKNSEATG